MGYFTESVYERMMTSRPNASSQVVKRNRHEMLEEYRTSGIFVKKQTEQKEGIKNDA